MMERLASIRNKRAPSRFADYVLAQEKADKKESCTNSPPVIASLPDETKTVVRHGSESFCREEEVALPCEQHPSKHKTKTASGCGRVATRSSSQPRCLTYNLRRLSGRRLEALRPPGRKTKGLPKRVSTANRSSVHAGEKAVSHRASDPAQETQTLLPRFSLRVRFKGLHRPLAPSSFTVAPLSNEAQPVAMVPSTRPIKRALSWDCQGLPRKRRSIISLRGQAQGSSGTNGGSGSGEGPTNGHVEVERSPANESHHHSRIPGSRTKAGGSNAKLRLHENREKMVQEGATPAMNNKILGQSRLKRKRGHESSGNLQITALDPGEGVAAPPLTDPCPAVWRRSLRLRIKGLRDPKVQLVQTGEAKRYTEPLGRVHPGQQAPWQGRQLPSCKTRGNWVRRLCLGPRPLNGARVPEEGVRRSRRIPRRNCRLTGGGDFLSDFSSEEIEPVMPDGGPQQQEEVSAPPAVCESPPEGLIVGDEPPSSDCMATASGAGDAGLDGRHTACPAPGELCSTVISEVEVDHGQQPSVHEGEKAVFGVDRGPRDASEQAAQSFGSVADPRSLDLVGVGLCGGPRVVAREVSKATHWGKPQGELVQHLEEGCQEVFVKEMASGGTLQPQEINSAGSIPEAQLPTTSPPGKEQATHVLESTPKVTNHGPARPQVQDGQLDPRTPVRATPEGQKRQRARTTERGRPLGRPHKRNELASGTCEGRGLRSVLSSSMPIPPLGCLSDWLPLPGQHQNQVTPPATCYRFMRPGNHFQYNKGPKPVESSRLPGCSPLARIRFILRAISELTRLGPERDDCPLAAPYQRPLGGTSGVSYVVPSESHQEGVQDKYKSLAHIVIRPRHMTEIPLTADVQTQLEVLRHQPVLAVNALVKADQWVKDYLLSPRSRQEICSTSGGTVAVVDGLHGAKHLLGDRTFLCLHYRYEAAAQGLVPICPKEDVKLSVQLVVPLNSCGATPGPTSDQAGMLVKVMLSYVSPPASSHGHLLETSNVQITLALKKGVGGTCPYRAAARWLAASGLLDCSLQDGGAHNGLAKGSSLEKPSHSGSQAHAGLFPSHADDETLGMYQQRPSARQARAPAAGHSRSYRVIDESQAGPDQDNGTCLLSAGTLPPSTPANRPGAVQANDDGWMRVFEKGRALRVYLESGVSDETEKSAHAILAAGSDCLGPSCRQPAVQSDMDIPEAAGDGKVPEVQGMARCPVKLMDHCTSELVRGVQDVPTGDVVGGQDARYGDPPRFSPLACTSNQSANSRSPYSLVPPNNSSCLAAAGGVSMQEWRSSLSFYRSCWVSSLPKATVPVSGVEPEVHVDAGRNVGGLLDTLHEAAGFVQQDDPACVRSEGQGDGEAGGQHVADFWPARDAGVKHQTEAGGSKRQETEGGSGPSTSKSSGVTNLKAMDPREASGLDLNEPTTPGTCCLMAAPSLPEVDMQCLQESLKHQGPQVQELGRCSGSASTQGPSLDIITPERKPPAMNPLPLSVTFQCAPSEPDGVGCCARAPWVVISDAACKKQEEEGERLEREPALMRIDAQGEGPHKLMWDKKSTGPDTAPPAGEQDHEEVMEEREGLDDLIMEMEAAGEPLPLPTGCDRLDHPRGGPVTLPMDENGMRGDRAVSQDDMHLPRPTTRGLTSVVDILSELRLYTLSGRLEMFVEEGLWKTLNSSEQDRLYTLIRHLEGGLQEQINKWNMESLHQHCHDMLQLLPGGDDPAGQGSIKPQGAEHGAEGLQLHDIHQDYQGQVRGDGDIQEQVDPALSGQALEQVTGGVKPHTVGPATSIHDHDTWGNDRVAALWDFGSQPQCTADKAGETPRSVADVGSDVDQAAAVGIRMEEQDGVSCQELMCTSGASCRPANPQPPFASVVSSLLSLLVGEEDVPDDLEVPEGNVQGAVLKASLGPPCHSGEVTKETKWVSMDPNPSAEQSSHDTPTACGSLPDGQLVLGQPQRPGSSALPTSETGASTIERYPGSAQAFSNTGNQVPGLAVEPHQSVDDRQRTSAWAQDPPAAHCEVSGTQMMGPPASSGEMTRGPTSGHGQHPWAPGIPIELATNVANQVVTAAAISSLASSLVSDLSHRLALGRFPWPHYLISTRDSFTHELVPVHHTMQAENGRRFVCTEWFFRQGDCPEDYQHPRVCPPVAQQLLSRTPSLVLKANRDGNTSKDLPMTHNGSGDSIRRDVCSASTAPGMSRCHADGSAHQDCSQDGFSGGLASLEVEDCRDNPPSHELSLQNSGQLERASTQPQRAAAGHRAGTGILGWQCKHIPDLQAGAFRLRKAIKRTCKCRQRASRISVETSCHDGRLNRGDHQAMQNRTYWDSMSSDSDNSTATDKDQDSDTSQVGGAETEEASLTSLKVVHHKSRAEPDSSSIPTAAHPIKDSEELQVLHQGGCMHQLSCERAGRGEHSHEASQFQISAKQLPPVGAVTPLIEQLKVLEASNPPTLTCQEVSTLSLKYTGMEDVSRTTVLSTSANGVEPGATAPGCSLNPCDTITLVARVLEGKKNMQPTRREAAARLISHVDPVPVPPDRLPSGHHLASHSPLAGLPLEAAASQHPGPLPSYPVPQDTDPGKAGSPQGLLPVGVTTYTGVFTHEELVAMEKEADMLDVKARQGQLPPECHHSTVGKGGRVKRTKMFFGARYLWTKDQLAEEHAKVAGGVRVDVPPPPAWIKSLVEDPLVDSHIMEKDFVNSAALNIYQDGSEGIQSHFDDADRFCRPIYSLRLFSDSRLSFGTQLYGYTNGAFFVPMPRGCVTVLEPEGYAANAIKHCVRPMDMTGRSAGLILRKINPQAMHAAKKLFVDDTGEKLMRMSLIHDATPPDVPQCVPGALPRVADKREKEDDAIQVAVRKVLRQLVNKVARVSEEETRRQLAREHKEQAVIAEVVDNMLREVARRERTRLQEEVTRNTIRKVMDKMLNSLETMAHPNNSNKAGVQSSRLPGQLRGTITNGPRKRALLHVGSGRPGGESVPDHGNVQTCKRQRPNNDPPLFGGLLPVLWPPVATCLIPLGGRIGRAMVLGKVGGWPRPGMPLLWSGAATAGPGSCQVSDSSSKQTNGQLSTALPLEQLTGYHLWNRGHNNGVPGMQRILVTQRSQSSSVPSLQGPLGPQITAPATNNASLVSSRGADHNTFPEPLECHTSQRSIACSGDAIADEEDGLPSRNKEVESQTRPSVAAESLMAEVGCLQEFQEDNYEVDQQMTSLSHDGEEAGEHGRSQGEAHPWHGSLKGYWQQLLMGEDD